MIANDRRLQCAAVRTGLTFELLAHDLSGRGSAGGEGTPPQLRCPKCKALIILHKWPTKGSAPARAPGNLMGTGAPNGSNTCATHLAPTALARERCRISDVRLRRGTYAVRPGGCDWLLRLQGCRRAARGVVFGTEIPSPVTRRICDSDWSEMELIFPPSTIKSVQEDLAQGHQLRGFAVRRR
jgi:hypothetical protein